MEGAVMSFWSNLTGRYLRDEGMALVLVPEQDFKARSREILNAWFSKLPSGSLFTGESMRFAIDLEAIGKPHHHNAWSAVIGGITRQWLKDGAARSYGTMTAQRPEAHARILRVYQKV